MPPAPSSSDASPTPPLRKAASPPPAAPQLTLPALAGSTRSCARGGPLGAQALGRSNVRDGCAAKPLPPPSAQSLPTLATLLTPAAAAASEVAPDALFEPSPAPALAAAPAPAPALYPSLSRGLAASRTAPGPKARESSPPGKADGGRSNGSALFLRTSLPVAAEASPPSLASKARPAGAAAAAA